jgi:hypothetical protein
MEHVETAELIDGGADRWLQAVGVGHVGADRDCLVAREVSGLFAGSCVDLGNGDLCPSLANRIAVARPIPLPAPVMKATLPAGLSIVLFFSTANSKTARSGRFT